jgi:1-acyl-sn-glycerol-3-phosphate acyltransferase
MNRTTANPVLPETSSDRAILLPKVSRRGLALFGAYVRLYLRRHFHGVRVLRSSLVPLAGHRPLLIYSNHASWWDPLVALTAQRALFPGRTIYGPIAAAALRRYPFLGRLGLFGVEAQSPGGTHRFLRTAKEILARESAMLWLTPQGRFADARERPPQFRRGLGHLLARCPGVMVLPVAMEYAFWGERLPEALIAFGEPLENGIGSRQTMGSGDPSVLTRMSEEKLARTQDSLAQASMSRDAERFETLLEGGAGVGGVYDLWRRCRSYLRGETFNPAHGA